MVQDKLAYFLLADVENSYTQEKEANKRRKSLDVLTQIKLNIFGV